VTPVLTWRLVERYRRQKLARYHIRSQRQALGFVEALGFCYAFTSGPGYLPGLFDVLATRSVDRMWSWAWRWKDELAAQRRLFYGKVLRRKPTYVAMDYLPHFFALSGNVGERDDLHQVVRAAGRINTTAAAVIMLDRYLQTVGAVRPSTVRDLFDWPARTLEEAHRSLRDRIVQREVERTPVWAHVTFERWRDR